MLVMLFKFKTHFPHSLPLLINESNKKSVFYGRNDMIKRGEFKLKAKTNLPTLISVKEIRFSCFNAKSQPYSRNSLRKTLFLI